MAQKNSDLEVLKSHLKHYKIATLKQLKEELGTSSTMTVFRRLKSLDYLSSYSHRGKYYSLHSIAEFDETGLWSSNSIWFSKYGNLIETSKEFIDRSDIGFTAHELTQILNVEVKHTLLQLFKQKRIWRKRIESCFIYFSSHTEKRRQQITTRKNSSFNDDIDFCYEINVLRDELKAAIILFYSLLDEKQRRLYAGLESYKLGHGGDTIIAELLGLTTRTVAKGRAELLNGRIPTDKVRGKGGGRKTVEKKFRKS